MYYSINVPRVVHELADGEVIAINFDTGTYYSMQGVAAYIWCLLAQAVEDSEIVEFMAGRFPLEREMLITDVNEFLGALVESGLVSAQESPGRLDGTGLKVAAPERYTKPVVEKYTDMEQLLLLDPVHEVDEAAGWPAKK